MGDELTTSVPCGRSQNPEVTIRHTCPISIPSGNLLSVEGGERKSTQRQSHVEGSPLGLCIPR